MAKPLVHSDTLGALTRKRTEDWIAASNNVAVSALADSAATLTATQLIDSKILSGTPTADRVLTSPTAALLVAALEGYAVGHSVQFTIISLAAGFQYTLAGGTGVTISGDAVIFDSTSATFVAVVDSATAVTIYRTA